MSSNPPGGNDSVRLRYTVEGQDSVSDSLRSNTELLERMAAATLTADKSLTGLLDSAAALSRVTASGTGGLEQMAASLLKTSQSTTALLQAAALLERQYDSSSGALTDMTGRVAALNALLGDTVTESEAVGAALSQAFSSPGAGQSGGLTEDSLRANGYDTDGIRAFLEQQAAIQRIIDEVEAELQAEGVTVDDLSSRYLTLAQSVREASDATARLGSPGPSGPGTFDFGSRGAPTQGLFSTGGGAGGGTTDQLGSGNTPVILPAPTTTLLDAASGSTAQLTERLSIFTQVVGEADPLLVQYDALLGQLSIAAEQAGVPLSVLVDTEGLYGIEVQKQIPILRQLLEMYDYMPGKRQAEAQALAQETEGVINLNLELEKELNLQRQSGRPGTNYGQAALQGAPTVGPAAERFIPGGQDVANRSLAARFENAAKGIRQTKEAADDAAGSITNLSGVTLIGTTALSNFGFEGARGIETVSRSLILLKEQGKGVGDIFDTIVNNKLIGFTAILITVAAAITAFRNWSEEILRASEELEKLETASARVSQIGLTGGVSQNESDLKKLESAQRDLQLLRGRGDNDRANTLLGQTLGLGKSQEEINAAEAKLAEAEKKQAERPFRFAIPFVRLIGETQEDRDKAVDEARLKLREARGGAVTDQQLDTRVAEARRDFDAFQLSLEDRGDKDNIFDKAGESLRKLADTTGRTKDLAAFIDGLRDRAREGSLSFLDYSNAVKTFKESLEGSHEAMEDWARFNKKLTEEFTKARREMALRNQATKEIQSLDRQLASDDPLSAALEKWVAKTDQFAAKYATLPEKLKEINERLKKELDVEAFKANIVDSLQLGKLGTEASKLADHGSLFGNETERSQEQRDRTLEARIREDRRTGNVDDLQAAAAGLGPGGEARELETQAAQAGRRGEFVRQAELLNKADDARRKDDLRTFNRDALDSQLNILQEAIARAGTDQQRRFAADQILSLTSNVGELTSSERDLRLKTLQQRIALGEADRQRVLVEIRNLAPDVATASMDEEYGPRPQPGSIPAAAPAGFNPLQGRQ
jgi:hypothetical protein